MYISDKFSEMVSKGYFNYYKLFLTSKYIVIGTFMHNCDVNILY